MKKVRDEPRSGKIKKPRPDPPDPPVIDPDPPDYIILPVPIPIPGPVPLPDPPPSYDYGYYVEEPPPTNMETASIILTSATLVWNASYIRAGDSNAFVATAGIFTGLSSLAMAFSDQARYPILDFLLGTTQLVLSIANFSNGVQFASPADDDYYSDSYYSPPSTDVNLINYSYSF
jgi:hypothetical protein